MSYAISIEKRTNGGYTVTYDGKTSYPSQLQYHGTEDGIILFSRGLTLLRFYRPAEWTIQGVSGFTTVVSVCDALDALGVLPSDTIDDIKALCTTIDADTGTLVTDVGAIKTAVEKMDDWDESDRAKVNIIAGQAGVEPLAGRVTVKTPRIVIAKPDYVDTTSETVLYEGYSNGTNYDVCKIDLSTAVISRMWATGAWADRASLIYA